MDPHRLAELRSLSLHREIADRLRADPALVASARARLARWSEDGTLSPAYVEAWRPVLDGPLDALLSFITEDSERARELRQATPFTFVIPPRERWAIWRAVKAEAV